MLLYYREERLNDRFLEWYSCHWRFSLLFPFSLCLSLLISLSYHYLPDYAAISFMSCSLHVKCFLLFELIDIPILSAFFPCLCYLLQMSTMLVKKCFLLSFLALFLLCFLVCFKIIVALCQFKGDFHVLTSRLVNS